MGAPVLGQLGEVNVEGAGGRLHHKADVVVREHPPAHHHHPLEVVGHPVEGEHVARRPPRGELGLEAGPRARHPVGGRGRVEEVVLAEDAEELADVGPERPGLRRGVAEGGALASATTVRTHPPRARDDARMVAAALGGVEHAGRDGGEVGVDWGGHALLDLVVLVGEAVLETA